MYFKAGYLNNILLYLLAGYAGYQNLFCKGTNIVPLMLLCVLSSFLLTLSLFFLFSEAKAVIEGPDEKYIKAGSSLKLVCRFENVTQHPETVFWWVSLE